MVNHVFTPLFKLSPYIQGCCFRLTHPFRNPEKEKFAVYPTFSVESPLLGESGVLGCTLGLLRLAAEITEN
jgi:hypothetical protein